MFYDLFTFYCVASFSSSVPLW